MSPSLNYEMAMTSACYWVVAGCFVIPPNAFVSVGFTIQNIFSSLLGPEHLHFVSYQKRRALITRLVHGLLPVGHMIILIATYPSLLMWISDWFPFQLYATLVLGWTILILMLTLQRAAGNFERDPITETFQRFDADGQAAELSVDAEFCTVDKFTCGPLGRRIVVTPTWIVQEEAYTIKVARQADVELIVAEARQIQLHHQVEHGTQVVFLDVVPRNGGGKLFTIKLNALDYAELQPHVNAPITNVRNVVIHQSLSEQFVSAFSAQVAENNPYRCADSERENCIGCFVIPSDCKLVKQCVSEACMSCRCRPMWCLSCMGRWFASRQDQAWPQTWMEGRAPCPTCRAVFCLADICPVVVTDL